MQTGCSTHWYMLRPELRRDHAKQGCVPEKELELGTGQARLVYSIHQHLCRPDLGWVRLS